MKMTRLFAVLVLSAIGSTNAKGGTAFEQLGCNDFFSEAEVTQSEGRVAAKFTSMGSSQKLKELLRSLFPAMHPTLIRAYGCVELSFSIPMESCVGSSPRYSELISCSQESQTTLKVRAKLSCSENHPWDEYLVGLDSVRLSSEHVFSGQGNSVTNLSFNTLFRVSGSSSTLSFSPYKPFILQRYTIEDEHHSDCRMDGKLLER